MKMEWTKQRVFECEVIDAWGPTRKRVICRHRDDGTMYALTVTIGHPLFDTREHIVQEFARFACQREQIRPCSEHDFDETFLMNLRNYNGTEITSGLFYSFPDIDPSRVREWEEKQWSRPIPQRLVGEPTFPENFKQGLP
jgi:hypothetical protein